MNSSKREIRPGRIWIPWLLAIAFLLAALLVGLTAWGYRQDARTARAEAGAGGEGARMQQEIANLRQSDQISRQAMLDLQNTLTERDEQIAALRADLDFYERFVSPDVQRRGLSVHAAHVRPQAAENVWGFELTLTQGREQAGTSRGNVQLTVEGSRNGKLEQLDWADLRQKPDAPAIDYQLRYLQRVSGEFALPAGFTPTRLIVQLKPASGKAVETAFNWKDIAGA